MTTLGAHLTLLIGPTVPLPAPAPLVDALSGAEVTHQDEGRSGFQLTFDVGRAGPSGAADYPAVLAPLLRPFNRVILVIAFGGVSSVLMDGVITHQQLSPSNEPRASRLTVTGEDVSVMMDLQHRRRPWPALPEPAIALAIIGTYAQYGLVPMIVPPPALDVPLPTQRTPMQAGTDLGFLQEMAARFAWVFYVEPGPAPGANIAYWGPPKRATVPQPALSVNVGSATNVEQIGFSYNALAPNTVAFSIQDGDGNTQFSYETRASTRVPLSLRPALPANQPNVRRVDMGIVQAERPGERASQGGETIARAIARAQALTDRSTDAVVTATGSLDAARYGRFLRPRGLVGLRGAGLTYDGLYYVRSVTHSISRGAYKQRFMLTRDGVGATIPAVVP